MRNENGVNHLVLHARCQGGGVKTVHKDGSIKPLRMGIDTRIILCLYIGVILYVFGVPNCWF